MKKIVFVLLSVVLSTFVIAQQTPQKKNFSKINIDRAGDHIMLQLSSDHWFGVPDSISTNMKGLPRGINAYIMFDKRFKTNPFWSAAFGLGFSNSNIYFKNESPYPNGIGLVNQGASSVSFPSNNGVGTAIFKKYKLATTYIEIPVEMRYTFDPINESNSWKIAFGLKFGLLANAHTKGKGLEAPNSGTVNYTEKINSTSFFNSTRVAGTLRVGYGHYSLFGAYSLTNFLKGGTGDIRPMQIGITLSGL
ncbi:MAG TPA: outer membrane beta-barrel protein [Ferruginibacter sp.]|jgi:hypothetical protein|nr:outer membrane beta-barrel protein [Ferruginibacter sp.]